MARLCDEVQDMEAGRKNSDKAAGGGVESGFMKIVNATSKSCSSCNIQNSHYHGTRLCFFLYALAISSDT